MYNQYERAHMYNHYERAYVHTLHERACVHTSRARPREKDDAEEKAKYNPTDEKQSVEHRRHEAPLVLTFVQLLQFRSVDRVVVGHAEDTRK